jgi:hypothetical protein
VQDGTVTPNTDLLSFARTLATQRSQSWISKMEIPELTGVSKEGTCDEQLGQSRRP